MGYTLIDNDTGEVRHTDDDMSWYFNNLIQDKQSKEYYMTFIGMAALTRDKDLNATDWRVFSYLCEKMDKNGWADIPQDAIAREVQTYQANVNISLKKLVGKGYISKQLHPERERMILRVSPDVAGWGTLAVQKSRSAIARKIKRGAKNFNNTGEYVAIAAEGLEPYAPIKKPDV